MFQHSSVLRFITLLIVGFLLSSCSQDFTSMAEERLKFARTNQGDIEIVAIEDLAKSNYIKGVLLAAELINQRPNKLLGRTFKVNIEQEESTFEEMKPTIRRIISNPKITAVLGHRRSSIAVPASVVYERGQLIFMPSFSTTPALTGHNFQYVFRMVPSATVMADQIANVAKTFGYEKMVILYARDDLSRELAFLFEDAAVKEGIEFVKRSSFFGKETNYRPTISQFSSEKFDAIFIASSATAGGVMTKQLREMGINQPILGNDSYGHATFLHEAGNAAINTVIPSIYKPNENNQIINRFIQHYQEKYGELPDANAAQGYDSVLLLAAGIENAGDTIPSLLSSTLHYMPAWTGVTGIHSFSPSGDMLGKKYLFKAWKNGQWEDLPALHKPYLVKRFQEYAKANNSKKTITDFSSVFTKRIDDSDHKVYLLDLAHEILKFKRIGIIYENTADGRKAANQPLLQRLAKRKNIELVNCEIPFSILSPKEINQAMISCYGKLSLSSDALFIPSYQGISGYLQMKLTNSLAFFRIPAISLDERNTDPNISLVLHKRTDIDLQNTDSMQIYNGLLKDMKVNEFAEKLKGLPEISVNLKNLQHYNFPDASILTLSPDDYLRSNQNYSNKP